MYLNTLITTFPENSPSHLCILLLKYLSLKLWLCLFIALEER